MDAKDQAKAPQNKKKWVVIGAVAIVVVIAAIVGVVVGVKNNKSSSSSSSAASSSSGNSSSSSGSSTPSAGGNSTGGGSSGGNGPSSSAPVTKRMLFGYYGANAIANGVDIVKGLNGRTTPPANYQGSLASYCDSGNFDTINLAFLNIFGGGNNQFTITFGGFSDPTLHNGVYVYNGGNTETNDATVVQTFNAMGMEIQHCQSKGVKIVMSLGGDKVSNYVFVTGDGLAYATLFYNMFLEGTSPVRPFGPGVILDGIELDVEKNPNPSVWTPEMISLITNLRKLSPKTKLAIVPQCFLNGASNKDINVGDVIAATASILDYVIVQYYNNPQCSYPFNFNFKSWKALYNGPLVVGLAGDWTSAISGGFLEPAPLQAVYDMLKDDTQFLGFSVYDVSSASPPAFAWTVADYANPPVTAYASTLRNVLDGKVVGSGAPPQGDAISNINLGQRCGGTWTYANLTCSAATCVDNTGCKPSEQCFMFLAKC